MKYCVGCESTNIVDRTNFEYEGHIIDQGTVTVCNDCGEITLSADAADRYSLLIRKEKGFLLPDEMKKRRKDLGLSQQQVADALEVERVTYGRWEKNLRVPSGSKNEQLISYFDDCDNQKNRILFAREYSMKLHHAPKSENEYALVAHSNVPNILNDEIKQMIRAENE